MSKYCKLGPVLDEQARQAGYPPGHAEEMRIAIRNITMPRHKAILKDELNLPLTNKHIDWYGWKHLFPPGNPAFPVSEPQRAKGHAVLLAAFENMGLPSDPNGINTSTLLLAGPPDLTTNPIGSTLSAHGRGGHFGGSNRPRPIPHSTILGISPSDNEHRQKQQPQQTASRGRGGSRGGRGGGMVPTHSSHATDRRHLHWPWRDESGDIEFEIPIYTVFKCYLYGADRKSISAVEGYFKVTIEGEYPVADDKIFFHIWVQAQEKVQSESPPYHRAQSAYAFLLEYEKQLRWGYKRNGLSPYIDDFLFEYNQKGYVTVPDRIFAEVTKHTASSSLNAGPQYHQGVTLEPQTSGPSLANNNNTNTATVSPTAPTAPKGNKRKWEYFVEATETQSEASKIDAQKEIKRRLVDEEVTGRLMLSKDHMLSQVDKAVAKLRFIMMEVFDNLPVGHSFFAQYSQLLAQDGGNFQKTGSGQESPPERAEGEKKIIEEGLNTDDHMDSDEELRWYGLAGSP
ncbi:uncharacterized protein LY89DRAFT_765979 [Mollisia scopiformis]|uniref:Uncharacterized protein n=1 Tax=Mollisia scopiformis TaxID=149040 RepID=A0A132B6D6_MOLSC|nr:uncharacterized protein LY89DRAFT_765979 [Mollisia scopiformis]KUJ07901.1 hypothetical protein LY89DRAFT_765979 [Mollisia scopiformis]